MNEFEDLLPPSEQQEVSSLKWKLAATSVLCQTLALLTPPVSQFLEIDPQISEGIKTMGQLGGISTIYSVVILQAYESLPTFRRFINGDQPAETK